MFSYAILGPLHYLTEINWLRDKNYFIKSKKYWIIPFVIFSIAMVIYPVFSIIDVGFGNAILKGVNFIGGQTNNLLLIGFLFAVSLIFFKKPKNIILALLSVILISLSINFYLPKTLIFVGLFLPTLVHVYIFTLLFIIYGALKSNSKYGLYLGLTLFLVPFIIYYIPIDFVNYKPSQQTLNTFEKSNMQYVSSTIASLFGASNNTEFQILSEIGIRIQVFIAFAYTYHYLNWFSKTSIIGWKKSITKRKAYLIGFIWILAVSIYMYDFKTGYIALFFLSFLHVFLEFPLNIISIKEIFSLTRIKRRLVNNS